MEKVFVYCCGQQPEQRTLPRHRAPCEIAICPVHRLHYPDLATGLLDQPALSGFIRQFCRYTRSQKDFDATLESIPDRLLRRLNQHGDSSLNSNSPFEVSDVPVVTVVTFAL